MLVRPAEPQDRSAAVETLSEAFVADPMLRYLAPDDAAYSALAVAFFGCLFDLRVSGGGEVRVTDDVSAVSLWNPPGGNRLGGEQVEALWEQRVLRILDEAARERMGRFEAALDSIHPHEPHWYLGVVGVRADRRGEGLGGKVIRAVLDDPMAAGDPAYLATATEGNLAIYRRLGFEVIGETEISGGPYFWGMWRPASA
jgi:ribosomal protein S18 acetylase RimI-like enzyme